MSASATVKPAATLELFAASMAEMRPSASAVELREGGSRVLSGRKSGVVALLGQHGRGRDQGRRTQTENQFSHDYSSTSTNSGVHPC